MLAIEIGTYCLITVARLTTTTRRAAVVKFVVRSLVDSMQAPFYAFTSWEKPDEECRHNDTLCSARVPCTANYSAHM